MSLTLIPPSLAIPKVPPVPGGVGGFLKAPLAGALGGVLTDLLFPAPLADGTLPPGVKTPNNANDTWGGNSGINDDAGKPDPGSAQPGKQYRIQGTIQYTAYQYKSTPPNSSNISYSQSWGVSSSIVRVAPFGKPYPKTVWTGTTNKGIQLQIFLTGESTPVAQMHGSGTVSGKESYYYYTIQNFNWTITPINQGTPTNPIPTQENNNPIPMPEPEPISSLDPTPDPTPTPTQTNNPDPVGKGEPPPSDSPFPVDLPPPSDSTGLQDKINPIPNPPPSPKDDKVPPPPEEIEEEEKKVPPFPIPCLPANSCESGQKCDSSAVEAKLEEILDKLNNLEFPDIPECPDYSEDIDKLKVAIRAVLKNQNVERKISLTNMGFSVHNSMMLTNDTNTISPSAEIPQTPDVMYTLDEEELGSVVDAVAYKTEVLANLNAYYDVELKYLQKGSTIYNSAANCLNSLQLAIEIQRQYLRIINSKLVTLGNVLEENKIIDDDSNKFFAGDLAQFTLTQGYIDSFTLQTWQINFWKGGNLVEPVQISPIENNIETNIIDPLTTITQDLDDAVNNWESLGNAISTWLQNIANEVDALETDKNDLEITIEESTNYPEYLPPERQ